MYFVFLFNPRYEKRYGGKTVVCPGGNAYKMHCSVFTLSPRTHRPVCSRNHYVFSPSSFSFLYLIPVILQTFLVEQQNNCCIFEKQSRLRLKNNIYACFPLYFVRFIVFIRISLLSSPNIRITRIFF